MVLILPPNLPVTTGAAVAQGAMTQVKTLSQRIFCSALSDTSKMMRIDGYQDKLGYEHPQMPVVGAQLVEINLAVGNHEYQEQQGWEYRVKNGAKLIAQLI